jgi:hypothetical protein
MVAVLPSSSLPVAAFVWLVAGCCLLLLLAGASPVTSVHAAHAFDAYRLIQYDRGSTTYGSRRTTLNHQAIVPSTAEQQPAEVVEDDWQVEDEEDEVELVKAATQDLLRKVLVVRLASASPARIRSLLSRGAHGLLIVLPKDLTTLDPKDVARYKQLERYLAEHSWDAAIYFAFEDAYLAEMVHQLEFEAGVPAAAEVKGEKASTGDRYHLAVSTPDATALTGAMVSNFHGYQHASATSTAESENLPIIAIAASYDTLAAVPGLSRGLDQNGSGTIALLELTRIFHQLYSDFRTQGSYNLLFVLTAADRLNYAATKGWLRNLDSRQVESIEFALCLERLAAKPSTSVAAKDAPLYLHVSKLPKTPEVSAIYDGFHAQAKAMGIPLEMVHRKINISNPQVYWAHEQFARKRIVSFTLSAEKEPLTGWEQGSMFDGPEKIDLAVLKRNIEFVAEAISRHIYGLGKKKSSSATGDEVIRVLDEEGVNANVLASYSEFLSRHSRFTSYLQTDGAKSTSPLLAHLEASFKKYTADSKKQVLAVETLSGAGAGRPGMKLWKDKEGGVVSSTRAPRLGAVEMVAFQVKPITFELYLSGAIAMYLLVVYIVCQQPTSLGDVKAVLVGR